MMMMDVGKPYSKYFAGSNEVNYTKKNIATENKLILKYLKQKDIAPWFRGTSHFHIKGADMLLNALRDDAEQRTTHRVRSCLNMLGLEPMISSKQIMFLMHLSRGNDLVFLWFLMEMHYKTPKRNTNSYSINEQLICSAICHLDMITTLRELDKILPSGHSSRVEMKKARQKRQMLKELHTKGINQLNPCECVLPYFNKYPRPEFYGKRLFLEAPNFKVDFDIYSCYYNPNYAVPNEYNRWYANYHFNPGKRIVSLIIKETIKNIFYNSEAIISKLRSTEILCDYHKTMQIRAANLKHKIKIKARNECLKHYFKSLENKNQNYNKIVKMLHNAVKQQLCKFNEQRKTRQKDGSLKIITSDCKIFDVMLGHDGRCNEVVKIIDAMAIDPNNKENGKIHEKLKKEIGNVRASLCNDTNTNSYGKIRNGENFKEKHIKSFKANTNNFREVNKMEDNCDYVNANGIETPSDALFSRPTVNKPYKFDYKKILLLKCKDDAKKDIRKMFLAALDENTLNASTDSDQLDFEYDKAVIKCANNIFVNEVKRRNEVTAQAEEELNPLSQYPTLANYNAENFFLMEQMLSDAFQYLRQNPKFVWAQLPDAHKVPILREWIARRFGKVYTPMERTQLYRRSCKIFRALHNNLKFSTPNSNEIGKNLFLKYNCRKYLDKKVKQIKSKYYHRLDYSLLEHTRVFWLAMRANVCSNGPQRKSFFAYLPSTFRDIQHFRLWKSCDYRNNLVGPKKRREHF